jgi:hypothetical protein
VEALVVGAVALAAALGVVGFLGFVLTGGISGDDTRASGVFALLLFAGPLLLVLTIIGVVVATDPTAPLQIMILASLVTAIVEIAIERPDGSGPEPRARLVDLLGWVVLVCWAGVVVWQLRRVVTSDAEIEEKIGLVAPFIAAVFAIPIYVWVIEPLQRLLQLGEIGERFLRLIVAVLFGLAMQEIAVRLGIIPRL